jgi:hypothetical protein
MIEIKITSIETCDKPTLLAIAEMVNKLAASLDNTGVSNVTIAPADNPAAGSPSVSDAAQTFAAVEAVNPATAFAPTVTTTDAALAFGTPNPGDKFNTNLGNLPNAPVANAPGAVALAPALNTNPVLLDADKLPWDARIHSSARSQNADGRWKKKRGVDDMIVSVVESELRGVMALPSVPVVIPAAPLTPPTPPAPPTMAAPAAPLAPFPALLLKITGAKLDMNQVTAILQPMGIASLPILAARPDLIPSVEAQIDALIAS